MCYELYLAFFHVLPTYLTYLRLIQFEPVYHLSQAVKSSTDLFLVYSIAGLRGFVKSDSNDSVS